MPFLLSRISLLLNVNFIKLQCFGYVALVFGSSKHFFYIASLMSFDLQIKKDFSLLEDVFCNWAEFTKK